MKMAFGKLKEQSEVDFETFADEYKPVTVETDHGTVPRFGY